MPQIFLNLEQACEQFCYGSQIYLINFICIPTKKGHVGMKCTLETGWTGSYHLQIWDSLLENCVNIALMGLELQGVLSHLIHRNEWPGLMDWW